MKKVTLTKNDNTISLENVLSKLTKDDTWFGVDNPDSDLKTIIINTGLTFSQLSKDFLTRTAYKGSLKDYLTSLIIQEQVVLSFKSRKKLLKWWLK